MKKNRDTLSERQKEKLDTELIDACENQDLPLVMDLCLKGARPTFLEVTEILSRPESVKLFNFLWQTKLIWPEHAKCIMESAAINGNLELMKFLVENKVDIDFKEERTLSLASGNGNLEMVQFLVSKGADIKSSDALYRATANNAIDVVKYIIENNQYSDYIMCQTLFVACDRGYMDIAIYLIEKNANTLKQEEDLMRYTSGGGNLELFKYLIAKGVSPHVGNHIALVNAAVLSKKEIVQYLTIEHNCNLNDMEDRYKKNINQDLFDWNDSYIESKKLNTFLEKELKENSIKKIKSKI